MSAPNEPWRILFIYLAAFPVYEGFVSGGERHFLEVARRWQSWGCHLEVLTTPTGAQILRENGIRAPVHVVSIPLEKGLARSNLGLAILYFLRSLAALPKLRRLRRDFRLICAVSHYLADTLPAASAGKLCPGAQVAIYLHHLEPPFRRRSRYQPLLPSLFSSLNSAASLFFIRRWAHRVLTFPAFGEALIQRGIPSQRLFFTANAVDWDGISRATSATKEYQACFMGRIAPLKGMDDLVEVWKRVCQELPEARLVAMGGDGAAMEARFHRALRQAGLAQNVDFLGLVSEAAKYTNIKGSQVFLYPSYEEGWGISLAEAMACGIPAVVYDLPAYRAFGGEGLLRVPIGDRAALSQAVLRLLQQPELREAMGRKAFEAARRFSWDAVADQELKALAGPSFPNAQGQG